MENTHIQEEAKARIDLAVVKGEQGLSCSEAITAAYASFFNLPESAAVKIAAGFGGGMAMGRTCGAVTAAFMIIGLKYGTDDPRDIYKRQNTYLLVSEFAERFTKHCGSLNCRELCAGHDMSTREGAQKLRASGKPALMIKTSAELLEEIFKEQA